MKILLTELTIATLFTLILVMNCLEVPDKSHSPSSEEYLVEEMVL